MACKFSALIVTSEAEAEILFSRALSSLSLGELVSPISESGAESSFGGGAFQTRRMVPAILDYSQRKEDV